MPAIGERLKTSSPEAVAKFLAGQSRRFAKKYGILGPADHSLPFKAATGGKEAQRPLEAAQYYFPRGARCLTPETQIIKFRGVPTAVLLPLEQLRKQGVIEVQIDLDAPLGSTLNQVNKIVLDWRS